MWNKQVTVRSHNKHKQTRTRQTYSGWEGWEQFTAAQEGEPVEGEEITLKCDKQIMRNKEMDAFDSFVWGAHEVVGFGCKSAP